jgi:hypothetical protein
MAAVASVGAIATQVSGQPLNTPVPSGVVAGELVIIMANTGGTAATCPGFNLYTQQGSVSILWKVSTTTDSGTYAVGTGGNVTVAQAFRITGAAATNPLADFNYATGNTNGAVNTALTGVPANNLLLLLDRLQATRAISTVPTGFTAHTSGTVNIHAASMTSPGGDTGNVAFTFSGFSTTQNNFLLSINSAPPVQTGTQALTTKKPTLGLTGSYAVPTYNGTLGANNPHTVLGLAGGYAVPTYSGTLAGGLLKPVLVTTGTYADPSYTGTLAVSGLVPLFDSEGDYSVPSGEGSLDLTAPIPILGLVGDYAVPVYDGSLTASGLLPVLTAEGAHAVPTYEGSLDAISTLPVFDAGGGTIEEITGDFGFATQAPGFFFWQGTYAPLIEGTADFVLALPDLRMNGDFIESHPQGSAALVSLIPTSDLTGEYQSAQYVGVLAARSIVSTGTFTGTYLAPVLGTFDLTTKTPNLDFAGTEFLSGGLSAISLSPNIEFVAVYNPSGQFGARGRLPLLRVHGTYLSAGVIFNRFARGLIIVEESNSIEEEGEDEISLTAYILPTQEEWTWVNEDLGLLDLSTDSEEVTVEATPTEDSAVVTGDEVENYYGHV